MAISIEEAKAFKTDAEKARDNWLTIAKKSWNEIKKRRANNKLWSVVPNSTRTRAKYPLWYSIFKIRQPLILSRIGIPICKDTTQDGNDTIGATAAILRERLAVNLAKSFDFYETLCGVRDDFLAGNFAGARAFYYCEEKKQKVKEYIKPQPIESDQQSGPETAPSVDNMRFVDADGNEISGQEILEDDEGFFIEHEQTVDIDDERIELEHVLYAHWYVDPDITKWKRCKRLAFSEFYSVPEFKEVFGNKAYTDYTINKNLSDNTEASEKRQNIEVIEYWDDYEKQVYWFTEHNSDFIKPKKMLLPENEEAQEGDETLNGLYDLHRFFPTPNPLIMNAPTDEFWPIPEFYQLVDLGEEINQIFNNMVQGVRALRIRLMYDSSIDSLQAALNEASSYDAIGISNLTQLLQGAGGDLSAVVQYIPVGPIIESINQLNQNLENRLNQYYKLTGTSDLLQGLITDPTQRTFGERQMTEKYALNQIAEPQKKMAEFTRDCYELITEMALKNFSDQSLDKYIMPQTLQPEDRQRYRAALEMLKQDTKRFRIEVETDSTIAINEDYDKRVRVELVNALTAGLEKTANIAQTSPALVAVELHCLKYLIQGFRQGKMFQSEITEAIDNLIKQAEEASKNAPPPFNKDEAMIKVKQMELQSDNQIRVAEMQSRERIEAMKIQQDAQLAAINNQLEQFKMQMDANASNSQLQLEYSKLNASINEAQQNLQLKHDEMLVELRKIADKKEVDQFSAMIDQRVAEYENQLNQQQLQVELYQAQLIEREKAQMEARHAAEQELEHIKMGLEAMRVQKEMSTPPPMPDIINHIHMPEPKTVKKKVKVERDPMGNITNFESQDVAEPISE